MFVFFNDTATTEIYTLSLHDALPISQGQNEVAGRDVDRLSDAPGLPGDRHLTHRHLMLIGPLAKRLERLIDVAARIDRKSTRLNSSHANISYAVFCLKKKNNIECITY